MSEYKSALTVTMECTDEDTVLCFGEEGKLEARGPWYCDRVMCWLLDKPRSRYIAKRKDCTTVEVTRL